MGASLILKGWPALWGAHPLSTWGASWLSRRSKRQRILSAKSSKRDILRNPRNSGPNPLWRKRWRNLQNVPLVPRLESTSTKTETPGSPRSPQSRLNVSTLPPTYPKTGVTKNILVIRGSPLIPRGIIRPAIAESSGPCGSSPALLPGGDQRALQGSARSWPDRAERRLRSSTLMGYDADHAFSEGEVGKCGVAIASLEDMEMLFDGIPLDTVTVSMTINSPASDLLGDVPGSGRKARRRLKEDFGNGSERHSEGIHRAEGVHLSSRPSMRLVIDTFEYRAKHFPVSTRFRSSVITSAKPARLRSRSLLSPCDGVEYVGVWARRSRHGC